MTRQEALELLPWHVAGSLSSAESQAVQAFIDSGGIDSGALAEFTLLAGELGTEAASEPAYRSGLLDDVLARLDEPPQAAALAAAPVVTLVQAEAFR